VEYVARTVQTSYKKTITLMNVFNSHCNIMIDVRAKNIDTYQVLQHSLFYDIYTRNNKKQLQLLYYDECIYNISNIRLFSIRNIYSKTLNIEIKIKHSNDLKIYLIRNLNQYELDVNLISKKNNSNIIGSILSDNSISAAAAAYEMLSYSPSIDSTTRSLKFRRSASFAGEEVLAEIDSNKQTMKTPKPNRVERMFSNDIDIEKSMMDFDTASYSTGILDYLSSPRVVNSVVRNLSKEPETVEKPPPPVIPNKDFLMTMDSTGFPFSLFSTSNDESLKATQDAEALSTIQKCYRQLNEVIITYFYILYELSNIYVLN
jgi:hypothetical protein